MLGFTALVIAVAFTLAWWLTSPRYVGWLVFRRLRKLRRSARALNSVFGELPEPTCNIVVIKRAKRLNLPMQRREEPSDRVARVPVYVRSAC